MAVQSWQLNKVFPRSNLPGKGSAICIQRTIVFSIFFVVVLHVPVLLAKDPYLLYHILFKDTTFPLLTQ